MSTYWQNAPTTVEDIRCHCECGCSHMLAWHQMEDTGYVCDACYGEPGHAPLIKGDLPLDGGGKETMQSLELDVVSAHGDYTPNKVDYDIAKPLFSATLGDYSFTISLGADDSAFIMWSDHVANEWIEHFEKLSHAIARLAHIQHCAETAWRQSINSHPRVFANKFEFLVQDKWI